VIRHYAILEPNGVIRYLCHFGTKWCNTQLRHLGPSGVVRNYAILEPNGVIRHYAVLGTKWLRHYAILGPKMV
jgi:hypothetical protein